VQDRLREWTGKPEELRKGDRTAIEGLFEGLILTGVAMQISKSSRPASGIEHRFSHLWEMQALAYGTPPVPHGFKVGIGTLGGAALYERLLAREMEKLTDSYIEARCRGWPTRSQVEQSVRQAHDIGVLAESAVEESLAKHIDPDELRQRLLLLRERWPLIKERLAQQLLPASEIRHLLEAAGCPVHASQIGVDRTGLKESYELARTIRRRYSVLDLLAETGFSHELVDDMFRPGGFWGS